VHRENDVVHITMNIYYNKINLHFAFASTVKFLPACFFTTEFHISTAYLSTCWKYYDTYNST